MILYQDIYQKAINLFDDPEIDRAYVQNKVRFAKLMYPHLDNGIQKFKNPTAITWELMDRTPPEGKAEIFSGAEVAGRTLVLSTVPLAGSDYSVTVAGNYVYDYTVVEENGVTQIVFGDDVNIGIDDEISVEWYYAGCFNTDFSSASATLITPQTIADKVTDILARTLVLSWAEKNKNFILEIRNILTDTDFKICSPANAINSKVAWVKDLQFDVDTMQTKLGWDLFSVSRRAGGYYGA